ncbi:putative glycosyl hydrolases family 16 [Lyophyllum shimeji]|uniref:Glycosyl hydrolases family 16 n=1 Tax=Lyophyllum shimeji TaxID=47721 RepID=A0A9P3PUR6_LYOSH|nr:putative glycosyl hydrolases family 16 [Lyophyllum shimeji]
MHMITTFIVLSLALGSLAGNVQERAFSTRRRHHQRVARAQNNNTRIFKLEDMYQGDSFLNDWDFMQGADPTRGSVNYQSKDDAVNKHLAYVQSDGTTVLAVDDSSWVPEGGNRDSVRISTKKKYNGGLFIADFYAMPHGCSVWPAYWSVGPNWPNGGEIDILEGVHEQPANQYTVHTGPGCTLTTANVPVTGRVASTQCATINGDNTGCAFVDPDSRSYGKGFNLIAGGVFAHLWDSTGIKIWHFPRTEIPEDIIAKNPDPSKWKDPVAYWSASSCDMASHFYEQSLVLDTTLCGDWGKPTYQGAGCPGTCAQAVMDPANYAFAKWKINYIAVYQ